MKNWFERLNAWLLIAAIVVGAASVVATAVISDSRTRADRAALCILETRENKQTREFLASLVADPSVPTKTRQKVVATALVSFPLVPQSCLAIR